jgi:hypothetical protein
VENLGGIEQLPILKTPHAVRRVEEGVVERTFPSKEEVRRVV